jgi:hypothetical protein
VRGVLHIHVPRLTVTFVVQGRTKCLGTSPGHHAQGTPSTA